MGQPVKRPKGRTVSLLWSRDRELSEVRLDKEVLDISVNWLWDNRRMWRLIRELKLSGSIFARLLCWRFSIWRLFCSDKTLLSSLVRALWLRSRATSLWRPEKMVSESRWLEMSLWEMFRRRRFSSPLNISLDNRDKELFWRKSFWREVDFLKMVGGSAASWLWEMSRRERWGRAWRELSDKTDRRLPEILKFNVFQNNFQIKNRWGSLLIKIFTF